MDSLFFNQICTDQKRFGVGAILYIIKINFYCRNNIRFIQCCYTCDFVDLIFLTVHKTKKDAENGHAVQLNTVEQQTNQKIFFCLPYSLKEDSHYLKDMNSINQVFLEPRMSQSDYFTHQRPCFFYDLESDYFLMERCHPHTASRIIILQVIFSLFFSRSCITMSTTIDDNDDLNVVIH
ncbi:hypothetical protein ALC53_06238 [Atta colombica]|uniref:Uncharacterized protein n=1 Tax=Atta colombica TaxID=520822 RepID=A0A151I3G4_9HYME|nr:hypothetical protein ALC53_06238 [Atta colombica]